MIQPSRLFLAAVTFLAVLLVGSQVGLAVVR